LGNILDGDLGVACQVLVTFSVAPFEDSVNILYAVADSRYAGGLPKEFLFIRIEPQSTQGF